jgi:hypothetical protein
MSLVQSCRSFGVEPFAYLRDVLDRVSTETVPLDLVARYAYSNICAYIQLCVTH